MSDEITLDTVVLPEDLYWSDYLTWTPVASNIEYGITGAGFVDASKMLTGREITLVGEDENCWISRAQLVALQTLAADPGKQMNFTYHGESFTVLFAPGEKPFSAVPLFTEWPVEDGDTWILTALRLIEITE